MENLASKGPPMKNLVCNEKFGINCASAEAQFGDRRQSSTSYDRLNFINHKILWFLILWLSDRRSYGCPKKNLWLSEKNLWLSEKILWLSEKRSYGCPKKIYGCPKRNLIVVRKKYYGCPNKNLWLSEKNLIVVRRKTYGCLKKILWLSEKNLMTKKILWL